MNLRSLCPCLALAALLGGSGVLSSCAKRAVALSSEPIIEAVQPLHEQVKPLGDLLSKGEGDWNAVNRGRAGDTPGGIQGLTGQTFENYTVGQVLDMQRRNLYAVGRYQFIPKTLRWAVANSDVSELDMFTPEVQNRLLLALITKKRPQVIAYLRGAGSLNSALLAMAREWASVEYRYGRGYYDHIGGNRAHISRASMAQTLKNLKETWTEA